MLEKDEINVPLTLRVSRDNFKIKEKPQIMYKIAKILQLLGGQAPHAPQRHAPLTPGPQVVTPPPLLI